MSKIKELKQELKTLANTITKAKQVYKQAQRTEFKHYQDWARQNNVLEHRSLGDKTYSYVIVPIELSNKYRHMHIAYCLLRGRTLEQIEGKTREDNKPNMKKVEDVMREHRDVDAISCGDSVVAS